jgi:hypothetical protein
VVINGRLRSGESLDKMLIDPEANGYKETKIGIGIEIGIKDS